MVRKIGVLSGGGDCPGTNAAIASIVKHGTQLGYELYGFERGLEGLLGDMSYCQLGLNDVKGISWLGGTVLKTTNKGRFSSKVGKHRTIAVDPEILQEAKQNLDSLGIEGLIVIGGDGTLASAQQLIDYGVHVVGVPKTIDNDLGFTDVTFGFSSAVDVAVDALDKIHTTATSHERTFIVECMGRSSGWITLSAGLAGGANAILLPEFEFSVDELIDFMRNRLHNNNRSTVIAIAEGAKVNGEYQYQQVESGEIQYSGAAEQLMHVINQRSGNEFDVRHAVLGHTQRGTNPNPTDRILSKRYGIAAIEVYDEGKFGHMVCVVNGDMRIVPIEKATEHVKRVTRDTNEYYAAKQLGIFLGS